MEDYGIFAPRRDVEHLMDRLDENKDGLISYGEFAKGVSPKTRRTNYWNFLEFHNRYNNL